jgi:hypothetical protein
MTLYVSSGDHHFYGNGNHDTTMFLETSIEVDKNGAMISNGSVPLEIN